MSNDYDPSDFDDPPEPQSTPAELARAQADAANAGRLMSNILSTNRQILASVSGLDAIAADLRAMMADGDARAAERAEHEVARDQRITDRLIDPDRLARSAANGARVGMVEVLTKPIDALISKITAEAEKRDALADQLETSHAEHVDHLKAERAERLAEEARGRAEWQAEAARRRKHDRYRNIAVWCSALVAVGGFAGGYELGHAAGDDAGYARARDEVAAASWANTDNGKLAHQLDQASEQTIPAIAGCPKDRGWKREKRDGAYWCFGANPDGKPYTGWLLP